MQLFDLLSAFTSRRSFGQSDPTATNRPWWNRYPSTTSTSATPTSEATTPVKTDSYVPSSETVPEATQPADQNKAADDTKQTKNSPVAKNADGTYYYRREARLDYQLDLRFDLATIARSVQQLSEGDTAEIQNLIAGGFGLSADFTASGYERIATNMTDGTAADGKSIQKQMTRNSSALAIAERFAQQDRAYALQGFYRQASKVRSSLHESVKDGHRQTTNKIAIRFQMDSKFSFALAERFNIQTQQVAEQKPDSLNGYLDSAGQVASSGTADLMAKFFDAVDGYLADSESSVRSQVDEFFTMATEQLGFDAGLVAAARDQLLGSVDSFFDRVSSAMGSLEALYAPSGANPGATPSVEPPAPTQTVPDQAMSEYSNELAVA